jgi:aldose 1-epimerase
VVPADNQERLVTIGEAFGATADDQAVHRVKIEGGGLTAHVLNWGAVVQDLCLEGHAPPLVLGFERFEDYLLHSPYFGAVAGRCANRIANGRFVLDGKAYQLDRNFLGKHHLHGGSKGFGKRVWEFVDHEHDFVTLRIVAADGEMGYPGRLTARCTYRLEDAGTLSVHLEAETDAPTLCNLAQHSYFNLDDGGVVDVLGHSLEIESDAYLPVDDEMIPTGELRPVEGTDFDFRAMRPIRREQNGDQVIYDHNFCLGQKRAPLRTIARAAGRRSGVRLEVRSSEPGVQFYAGHKISLPVLGLQNIRYGSRSGFCLEPQIWPDAANRASFPSAVLRPGETYRQVTEYRFAKD